MSDSTRFFVGVILNGFLTASFWLIVYICMLNYSAKQPVDFNDAGIAFGIFMIGTIGIMLGLFLGIIIRLLNKTALLSGLISFVLCFAGSLIIGGNGSSLNATALIATAISSALAACATAITARIFNTPNTLE